MRGVRRSRQSAALVFISGPDPNESPVQAKQPKYDKYTEPG
jgi:hypothetical protein